MCATAMLQRVLPVNTENEHNGLHTKVFIDTSVFMTNAALLPLLSSVLLLVAAPVSARTPGEIFIALLSLQQVRAALDVLRQSTTFSLRPEGDLLVLSCRGQDVALIAHPLLARLYDDPRIEPNDVLRRFANALDPQMALLLYADAVSLYGALIDDGTATLEDVERVHEARVTYLQGMVDGAHGDLGSEFERLHGREFSLHPQNRALWPSAPSKAA